MSSNAHVPPQTHTYCININECDENLDSKQTNLNDRNPDVEGIDFLQAELAFER